MAVLKFRQPVVALSSFLRPSRSSHFLWLWRANNQDRFSPAKLGEVAAFGTYLKFVVECPRDSNTAANRMPVRSIKIKIIARPHGILNNSFTETMNFITMA